MTRRQYKTGTKWCLWRWSGADSGFISRLHILQTPFFAICLHIFHKPDPEPWLHDHPVSFLSFILRGSYVERRYRKGETRQRLVRWVNWIKGSPEDRHTITSCVPDTVSIAFMGPKTREWGYHTDKGWVYWRDYTHEKYRGDDLDAE